MNSVYKPKSQRPFCVLFIYFGISLLFSSNVFSQDNSGDQNEVTPKGQVLTYPDYHVKDVNAKTSKTALLNENFETALVGWTMNGSWKIDTPPSSGNSTLKAAGTSAFGATYNNNESSSLNSPQITLPAGEKYRLKFSEWFETESNYDYGKIRISIDNGVTWQEIDSRSGGSGNLWREKEIDLSTFAGKNIILNFYFTSDFSNTYRGWFVDNIVIEVVDTNHVTLTSLSNNNFPFIYLNADVKLPGSPPTILTANNFQLYENGILQTNDFIVTPPGSSGGVRTVDIVFVIDDTQSMDNEIAAVKNNINSFADKLVLSNVNYNLGLVTYKDNVTIRNGGNFTPDVNTFKEWVSGLVAGGGDGIPENGFAAIQSAISTFPFRLGSQRLVIMVTDASSHEAGVSRSDTATPEPPNLQQLVNSLKAANVTCHAAAINTVQYNGTGSITRETGGSYFPVTSNFDTILSSISNSVINSYVIQYKSSQPTQDGILRNIRLNATYNGNSREATGSYTPGSCPQISRTNNTIALSQTAQLNNSTISIAATITDAIAPLTQSVTLYYRKTGTTVYTNTPMTLVSGNYSATIPASNVVSPGMEYYLTATDGACTSSLPAVDASARPFSFAVLPNLPPSITHTPVLNALPNQSIGIVADITDTTTRLNATKVFYRKIGALLYNELSMTNQSGNSFLSTIPAANVEGSGLQYYIYAQDDFGVISLNGTADTPHFIPINNLVPPTPTAPTNAATNQSITPTLTYNAVSGATGYEVQISINNNFTDSNPSPIAVTGTSYTPSTALAYNTPYYWRVRAKNATGTSAWSAVWSFTTAQPANLVFSTPLLSFGEVLLYDTKTLSMTMTNSSSRDMSIKSLILPAGFALNYTRSTLPNLNYDYAYGSEISMQANETVTMRFTYTPKIVENVNFDFDIRNDTFSSFECKIASGTVPCKIILQGVGKARSYGTTVIVHGYTPPLAGNITSTWMYNMGKAIINRVGGCVYTIVSGVVTKSTTDCSSETGEKIVVFDWRADSNENAFGFAEGAGDALAAQLVKGAQEGKWNLNQLHFIGHSRGTVVSSEAIQRLGIYQDKGWVPNVNIDTNIHFTTLDSHPTNCSPANCGENIAEPYPFSTSNDSGVNGSAIKPVLAWNNVKYLDNYWQNSSTDLNGLSAITGAIYSRYLGTVGHSIPHVFYHGTADYATASDGDGGIINDAWYQNTERTTGGFNQSKVAGGNLNAFATVATRTNVNADPTYTSLFNGDFSKKTQAGWGLQGGGGSAPAGIVPFSGESNSKLFVSSSASSRVHNPILIPKSATELCYRYSQASTDPNNKSKLTVSLNSTVISSHPTWVSFADFGIKVTFKHICYPIPEALRGTVVSLGLSAEGLNGQSNFAPVYVDDLSFTKPNYLGFSVKKGTTATKTDAAKILPAIHVYDADNRHSGATTGNLLEFNIPNSYAEVSEDSTAIRIIVPKDARGYTVRFGSNGTVTPLSYTVEDTTDPNYTHFYVFENITAGTTTQVRHNYNGTYATGAAPIQIDNNGDGTPETTQPVTTTLKPYVVRNTVGANGTISVANEVVVSHGNNLTIQITPNTGYVIDVLKVNGVVVPNTNSYVFNNITADQSLEVTFKSDALVFATGLVAYYPFNGNANDESGKGNNGVVSGAVLTTDRYNQPNKAYSFALGKKINIPSSATLQFSQAFSYAAWINLASFAGIDGWGRVSNTGHQAIFSKDCDFALLQSGIGAVDVNTGTFNFGTGTSTTYVSATNQPSILNKWTHVATTYNGTVAKVFINGILLATKTGVIDFAPSNSKSLVLGGFGCWNYYFNGKLDDFRFYNIAVSDQTIKDLYNHEKQGSIIPNDVEELPAETILLENYPNPFSDVTNLKVLLPEDSNAKIKVYDALGRAVYQTDEMILGAGENVIPINAQELSSGIYMYEIWLISNTPQILKGKFTVVK